MSTTISKPLVLVISLLSATERRSFMLSQLQVAGIDYRFFDATEGASLSPEWLEVNVRAELHSALVAKGGTQFAWNTIACANSHRRVQRWISEQSSDDFFMVLEDDAVLAPDFIESWAATCQSMIRLGRDVLFIGYSMSSGSTLGPELARIQGEYRVHEYPNRKIAGAVGYIVNRRGAKLLLQPNDPVIMDTADTWNIHERGIAPLVAVVAPKALSSGYFASSIGYNKGCFRNFLVRFLLRISALRAIYSGRQRRNLRGV